MPLLNSDLRRQLALTVALQLLAAVVMGAPMLVAGGLVNDRLAVFYFFRDTLHSLNVYGEFPWWNPSIWAGFPFYYFNFLYWPGRDPVFAAVAMIVWLLGRLHITIPSYHALYVAYIAFLVPLLLSLSVLALARQILRRRLAVYFVVVLMAFSPGVVFSASDFGSEVSAYGFFFAAALLHFLRRPIRSRFLLMCLPAMAMATLTFVELFWNVFFVPVFIALACIGSGGRDPHAGSRAGVHLTRRAARALRCVPGRWWAAAAVGVCLYALPSLVAYGHGADILSVRAEGRRYYAYDELRPGSPLEAIAISTPGIGFEWTNYEDPEASYTPRPVSRDSGFTSFGYMGMLTLPLVCLGLVLGRPYWSIRLYGAIAGVMTIMLLSAYSPVLSLFLGWPSPLRGANHYSDLVVRLGLFALFALAAGLGLEALLKSSPTRRWVFVALCAVIAAASVAWLVSLQGPAVTGNYVFGFTLALILLYGVGLTRLALARSAAQLRHACIVLMALTLVDTSTLAFAHLRLSLVHAGGQVREPDAGTIGSVVGIAETRVLYLRGMNDPALLRAPAQPVTLAAADTGEPLPEQDVDISRRTYNAVAMPLRRFEYTHLS